MSRFPIGGYRLGPLFPWVMGECVLSIGCEEFRQLPALLIREARTNADVLQCALRVPEDRHVAAVGRRRGHALGGRDLVVLGDGDVAKLGQLLEREG